MIRKGLVHLVLKDTGYEEHVIEEIITSFLDNMKITIGNSEEINLRGFGTFKPYTTKERIGQDMRKGISITIPPKRKVRFVPGGAIKEMLAGK